MRLARGTDSLAAALTLVEDRGVVAIPGSIFGAALEGWLRLSFVAPLADFTEGVRRIAAL